MGKNDYWVDTGAYEIQKPGAKQKDTKTLRIVILAVSIFLVLIFAFIGFIQLLLHLQKDTEEYKAAYQYLVTSDAFAEEIVKLTGKEGLSFFDAAAPIVTLESINMEKAFRASRYGRGEDDYINCPMTEEEYNAFYDALITAPSPTANVTSPRS